MDRGACSWEGSIVDLPQLARAAQSGHPGARNSPPKIVGGADPNAARAREAFEGLIRSCNAARQSFALALYILWFIVAYDDPEAPGTVLTTSTSQPSRTLVDMA